MRQALYTVYVIYVPAYIQYCAYRAEPGAFPELEENRSLLASKGIRRTTHAVPRKEHDVPVTTRGARRANRIV